MDQLTKCACKKAAKGIVGDVGFLIIILTLFVAAAYAIGWIIKNFQIVVNIAAACLVGLVILLVVMYVAGKYRDAKIACGWKPEKDENFIDYMSSENDDE